MTPFLYLIGFVAAFVCGNRVAHYFDLSVRDLLRKRDERIAFTWRRRIERGVEDIRTMYADRADDELRRKAEAAYQLDRSLYVQHGRRREPTPDLLKDLHRRQEAARRVVRAVQDDPDRRERLRKVAAGIVDAR